MRRTIPNARRTCTQRGCRLSILVVATYTSSETKAMSRHKSLLSGSFQQVSRVGLTPQILGTAPSDEDRRNRHQASFTNPSLSRKKIRRIKNEQVRKVFSSRDRFRAPCDVCPHSRGHHQRSCPRWRL